MLRISEDLIEQISKLVKQGYPKEVCGVLLGERDIEIKDVKDFHPLANATSENAANRYKIDPAEYKNIEEQAKQAGLEIIGVYHSHPDAAAKPSAVDSDEAWPVYSYLIFSCMNGKGVTSKSWEYNESSKKFEEEELDILAEEMGEA